MVDSVNTANTARLRAQSYQTEGPAKGPQVPSSGQPIGAVDRVALSDTVSVHLSEALAEKGPPFDLEKVARIKQAVADGNYPIDAARITDSIFQDYAAMTR